VINAVRIAPIIIPRKPTYIDLFIHFVCSKMVRLFQTCKAKINCGLSVGNSACHAANSESDFDLILSKSKVANSFCNFLIDSFFSCSCANRSARLFSRCFDNSLIYYSPNESVEKVCF